MHYGKYFLKWNISQLGKTAELIVSMQFVKHVTWSGSPLYIKTPQLTAFIIV